MIDQSQSLEILNNFDQARSLRGAAVKLSGQTGVDLDDVAQEMAIATLEIKASYGFEHVNSIVQMTREALNSYNYGVNAYYRQQGIAEISADQERAGDEESGDSWLVSFADDTFSWEQVDAKLDVAATINSLPEAEAGIAQGIMEGFNGKEIAEQVGLHNVTVSNKKKGLRENFSWAA